MVRLEFFCRRQIVINAFSINVTRDGFIVVCTSRNVSFSVSAGKHWSLGKRYERKLRRLVEYYIAIEIGLIINLLSECSESIKLFPTEFIRTYRQYKYNYNNNTLLIIGTECTFLLRSYSVPPKFESRIEHLFVRNGGKQRKRKMTKTFTRVRSLEKYPFHYCHYYY